MNVFDLITGMQTLAPYYDKQHGYWLSAEHDEISMNATDRPLSEEDLAKMIACGWHQEYDGRDYAEDFAAKHYRADEGWIAYV